MWKSGWMMLAATWLGCAGAPDVAEGTEDEVVIDSQGSELTLKERLRFPIKDFFPFKPAPESDEEAAGKFRPRSECRIYKYWMQPASKLDARGDVSVGFDEMCLETGHTGPKDNVAYVNVDNPRLWTGVNLPEGQGYSGRHYAGGSDWLWLDVDLDTTIGTPANWIRADRFPYRQIVTDATGKSYTFVQLNAGIYDDMLLPWAAREGSWGGAYPHDLTILAQGARIGYEPTRTMTTRTDRDGLNKYYHTYVSVALDPSVQLVPLQILVATSPSYRQRPYTEDGQLALWDRLPTVARTQQRPGLIDRELNQPTWIRSHVDPVGGVYGSMTVPDDIWAHCGVQFRLAAYNTLEVSDAGLMAAPNPLYPRATPRDLVEKHTSSERNVPGMPIVLFMPSCSGERSYADLGRDGTPYVCISTQEPRFGWDPATRLAYELGAMLGVQDPGTYCQTDPENLMCKGDGVWLTPAQCRVARGPATALRDKFFPPPLTMVTGGNKLPLPGATP